MNWPPPPSLIAHRPSWMVWPAPALLAWLGAWGLYLAGLALDLPMAAAFCIGQLAASAVALRCGSLWRLGLVASGFPLSLLATGHAALPAWLWLLPLGGLLMIYPLRSWRDAPLFPTPTLALQGLARRAPLPDGARVLEAGCGLGAGLLALQAEYPRARLLGLEWSWPLRWLCAWRCRFATVRRGDIWAHDWSAHQMVYLFQRPESMPRAVDKARAELRPGAWLVSLEFEATELKPTARLESVAGKPVWLYQVPLKRR
jgi:hypothetical protein